MEMRTKAAKLKNPADRVVKDIRRATRRHFSAEVKIVVRGYRVTTKYHLVTPDEVRHKRETIAKMIAKSVNKGPNDDEPDQEPND